MSEYDGPVINNFHLARDGVVLPPEVLDTPQRTIRDLGDLEWGMAYPGTVRTDQSSNIIIIDSFDSTPAQLLPDQMRYRPFVKALGAKAVRREYIVDIRRVDNYRFPLVDVGLDNGLDSDRFIERQKKLGSQVVSAMVVRNLDNIEFYGSSHLEMLSVVFAQEIDDFLEQHHSEISADKPINIPSMESINRNMQFHSFNLDHDIKTTLSDI